MKRKAMTIIALTAFIGMGIPFTRSFARVDQCQGKEGGPRNMLMDDKMEESKKHCQMSINAFNQLIEQIRDAKTLNDRQKMIAELDAAEAFVREAREHLTVCNNLVQSMDAPGRSTFRSF